MKRRWRVDTVSDDEGLPECQRTHVDRVSSEAEIVLARDLIRAIMASDVDEVNKMIRRIKHTEHPDVVIELADANTRPVARGQLFTR